MSNGTIQLPADGPGKRLATQTATRDALTVHREEDISYDFRTAVSLGLVDGHYIFRRFGRNPQITTATDPEDIWSTGGTKTYTTSAATIGVASTSPDDDGSPAGIGANTVYVEYLDASYATQTETLTLNGVGTVSTVGTAIRFIRGYVVNSNTDVRFLQRNFGGVFRPFDYLGLDASGDSNVVMEDVHGVSFPAKTDIKTVVVSVSSTVAVSCTYDVLLVPD